MDGKNKFLTNPKTIFLIDGVGALVSAFLLGVVLVSFESIFGIPRSALMVLAAIPVGFAIYDFLCYILVQKWRPFLKTIAILNTLYCILSLGFAFFHRADLQALGWAYIIIEIVIVLVLSFYEWRFSNKS